MTEVFSKPLLLKSIPNKPITLAAKFTQVLEAHRGERHLIVLHNFPDPDAISCAYAHHLISKEFAIESEIVYCGKISHQQNIALIRVLPVELLTFDGSLDLTRYDGAVYLDNQGTSCPDIMDSLSQAGVPTLMVVDHHELQERLNPEFSDIRRTGAAATIYAEYLEQGLLTLEKSREEHTIAATALMHGLITDTNNLLQASADDFHAAGFLSQYSDPDLLMQIMRQARSRQTMEIIRQSLANRTIVDNFSIAGVGYLRAEDRDAIPQGADILLTEENVHTALVYGILHNGGEEKLVGSLRTSKITLDPDQLIKDVFGKGPDGRFYGGGKDLAGGFEIPLGFLSGTSKEEDKQLKWQLFDRQVKQKLFDKIGVENGTPVKTS